MSWTTRDIPSQSGVLAIVTGANSGIGYQTALELARAGATVIVASRSEAKANAALAKIRIAVPDADVTFEPLDLASLASVAHFALRRRDIGRPVDILVNNAAVMMLPKRQVTPDGFETQLGTNYLGHFALTGRLLPLLSAANARVVQLSSVAHRRGQIALDDLQSERGYKPMVAYGQSKLAMLMFALELRRRSDAGGWGITSVAAHPGVARSELVRNGVGPGPQAAAMDLFVRIMGHSTAAGALPSLYAATAPAASPGAYYGPQKFFEWKGDVGTAEIKPQALDLGVAARLWSDSERLTGVKFAL